MDVFLNEINKETDESEPGSKCMLFSIKQKNKLTSLNLAPSLIIFIAKMKIATGPL